MEWSRSTRYFLITRFTYFPEFHIFNSLTFNGKWKWEIGIGFGNMNFHPISISFTDIPYTYLLTYNRINIITLNGKLKVLHVHIYVLAASEVA
jgi:hypothetical protein